MLVSVLNPLSQAELKPTFNQMVIKHLIGKVKHDSIDQINEKQFTIKS